VKLHVTFETGHPAKIDDLDGAVAAIYQDQRPLSGLAAKSDWRLNGFLSRLVMDDKFSGAPGDWLLVHTQGRLPFVHLFLVGMGRKAERSAAASRRVLKDIASKVALAGVHSVALDLAELAPPEMPSEEAMVIFLEALSLSYPEDELSDPPYFPALEIEDRNQERLETARKRRSELLKARQAWDAEKGAEMAEATASDEAPERPVAGAVPERPVAGAVPDDVESLGVSSPLPAAPPGPESVEEPELEARPERTVRVVFLGDPSTVGSMRKSLKRLSSEAFEVQWSR
jgi:hypothetical protein